MVLVLRLACSDHCKISLVTRRQYHISQAAAAWHTWPTKTILFKMSRTVFMARSVLNKEWNDRRLQHESTGAHHSAWQVGPAGLPAQRFETRNLFFCTDLFLPQCQGRSVPALRLHAKAGHHQRSGSRLMKHARAP